MLSQNTIGATEEVLLYSNHPFIMETFVLVVKLLDNVGAKRNSFTFLSIHAPTFSTFRRLHLERLQEKHFLFTWGVSAHDLETESIDIPLM